MVAFLFIATIIFAVIYIPYYFLGYGPTQKERYDESIAKADAAKEERMKTDVALVDENTVVINQAPEILSAGKEIFTTYCSACHGNEGEGGIGPNFADDYWIHGGSVKIFLQLLNTAFLKKEWLHGMKFLHHHK